MTPDDLFPGNFLAKSRGNKKSKETPLKLCEAAILYEDWDTIHHTITES